MKDKMLRMWHLLWTVGFVVLEIAAIASAIHALFNTRTSQGTIAWVVALIAFPLVSVPVYWFFGFRRYDRYAASLQEAMRTHASEMQAVYAMLEQYRPPADDPRLTDGIRSTEGLAVSPFLRGNRLELLVDGEATFDAILRGIDEAREWVLVQFYIVRDDALGRRLADALLARAAAGCRVYFLYDGWGSKDLEAGYVRRLRDGGVRVEVFDRPHDLRDRWQLNFRNHRKIVVVDGRVAYVGGHNVGVEYLGQDARYGHWRDTHLAIRGPAVLPVALTFVGDWHFATGEIVKVNFDGVREVADGVPVLTLPTGAADSIERCTLFFLHLITMARERLWIASPYFVPDEGVIYALQLAALRGVDVRILLPLEPDHKLVWLASFAYLEELNLPNVQVMRYRDGFLHQKVVLVDDRFASVGTANFDNRSFRLNFELTMAVADRGFNGEVESMLLKDFAKARVVEASEYHSKPLWFRAAAKGARLLGPIL